MQVNKKLLTSFVGLALATVTLAGCGGGNTRQALGLDRNTPDEFSVVSRAPLSLPPDYNLRPPRPGATRPQEMEPSQKAATMVLGTASSSIRTQVVSASAAGRATSGEQALLGVAGAAKADPNIRAVVDQESTSLVVADKGWVDSLLFWQTPALPGTVVNPTAEAQRLRTNAAQGKPVTEGDTPVIQRRKKAPLEGLFN
ncbi:MAG TPA: DUF3035 domain-containing protein [Azospirillaceae bacterium]|nr:DUF3035 domain-containing protein [Azospirillaceae bacterium]